MNKIFGVLVGRKNNTVSICVKMTSVVDFWTPSVKFSCVTEAVSSKASNFEPDLQARSRWSRKMKTKSFWKTQAIKNLGSNWEHWKQLRSLKSRVEIFAVLTQKWRQTRTHISQLFSLDCLKSAYATSSLFGTDIQKFLVGLSFLLMTQRIEGVNATEILLYSMNRTEQNRTEQNRTEQNRTEQNRTVWKSSWWIFVKISHSVWWSCTQTHHDVFEGLIPFLITTKAQVGVVLSTYRPFLHFVVCSSFRHTSFQQLASLNSSRDNHGSDVKRSRRCGGNEFRDW